MKFNNRIIKVTLIVGFFILPYVVSAQDITDIQAPASEKNAVKNEIANSEVTEKILAPIVQKKYFKGVRELMGYAPKYPVGIVNFDQNNRPYIISAENRPIIYTLNKSNQWITLDFGKDIKSKFPNWDGKINTGEFGSARITFDSEGDAYLYANTGRSNIGRSMLLHSKDQCRNWDVYLLPYKEFGRIENNDTFNLKKYPPSVLFFNIAGRPDGEMILIVPSKNNDGSLRFTDPITISTQTANCILHSGDGNNAVSVDDNIHIVWMSNQADDKVGERSFAATYNRLTGELSKPVFIGRSGVYGKPRIPPDNHSIPVITVDSQGYLHVILGTHHHPFTYIKSGTKNSIEKWGEPEVFGVLKKDMTKAQGSYTYPSINCDLNDNIHCVSRWAGVGYYFCLVHNEKSADKNKWLPQQVLVKPFSPMYACWYHKVSIDKSGNLAVYYINYHNQLNKEALAEYNKRWPEDDVNTAPAKERLWDKNIKPHDPVILMSRPEYSEWFIPTNNDFISNIKVEKSQMGNASKPNAVK